MAEKKAEWSGRMGFILASLGCAFGTGNIWRFPREVASNDGGAFLIAFVVANLVWAAPIVMIEYLMGKTTRLGTNGAFRNFVGRGGTWMGVWTGLCTAFIMFYYSIVMGWALRYIVYAATGALHVGVDTDALWNTFLNSNSQQIFFNFLCWVIAGWIIYRGVQEGLELANKIIVPSIIFLLLGIMVWALVSNFDKAVLGLEYIFAPKWSSLANSKIWLHAFTQAAWSIGAGWGLLLTYGRYMRDEDDIAANAMVVTFADSGSSLLAAMGVLPLVFIVSPTVEVANKALQSGNSGFTFIFLTKYFPTLPFGSVMALVFFVALAISALASLLSMIELATLNLQDVGFDRKKAALFVSTVGFLCGIPSAIWPNFFENQDMVWGVGLLVAGVFFAYAAMKVGVPRVRQMINEHSYFNVGPWFDILIYSFPLQFLFVFGWWVWQAYTWYPKTWLSPFETYSPGTMFLQWSILTAVVLVLNKWFANKVKAPYVLVCEEGKKK